MRRRVAVIVVIVATLAALFSVHLLKNFVDVDACLDRGGAWEKQTSTCVGMRNTHGQRH